MAETGQTGTHAPQSMHSTGSMNNWSVPSNLSESFFGWMQSTGHASTHAWSFVPIQGSAITYAISLSSLHRIQMSAGATLHIKDATKIPQLLHRIWNLFAWEEE